MPDLTKYEALLLTVDLVSRGKLYCRREFLETPIEDLLLICNGCGAANAKFDFVPDSIWGLWVGPVCNVHDFDYHHGTTERDRLQADIYMLLNLIRTIEAKSARWLRPIRRMRALSYYQAVREFGRDAFNKKGSE